MPISALDYLNYSLFLANFLSNGTLVIITLLSKRLRSPCNQLIALEAALLVICQPLSVVELLLVPTFFGHLTPKQCFALVSGDIFAHGVASTMPLAVAGERLLLVLCPVWAGNRKGFGHTCLLSALPFFYALVQTTFFGFRFLQQMSGDEGLKIGGVCTAATVYTALPENTWTLTVKGFVVVTLCWTVYVFIWFRVRRQLVRIGPSGDSSPSQQPQQQAEWFRRLTQSLAVILVLISTAWLTSAVTLGVLLARGSSKEEISTYYLPVGLNSLNLASALTLPALFVFSLEYRDAIVELYHQYINASPSTNPLFSSCRRIWENIWGISVQTTPPPGITIMVGQCPTERQRFGNGPSSRDNN